jgi:TolB-like protein/DNA-binding winged helix-turn-helix (wHTH) protein/tetratricopeptide (TPR) repeat protein
VPIEVLRYYKYRFGPYELQTRTRELYKQGTKLKLRPQPFQVLNLLLEHGGHVVSRAQLRGLLWPAETFVDFEQGLNTSIKTLRGVLNDSASEPRYIETLPKVGYRFIVPVEVNEVKSLLPNEANGPAQTKAVNSLSREKSTRVYDSSIHSWPSRIGISLVLIAALGGAFQWSRSRSHSQPSSGRLMLAVLPFKNLTGDSGQEYFSDGLTEEMIVQLGRIDPQHLGVIARTSVMRYKNTQEQMNQIGRELGVQYVLEGSVRRDANKMRITAQLIQTKDQTRMLSRQYDRELTSLLLLQGEIAQEISDEIQSTLGNRKSAGTPDQAPSLAPKSYEAYDLYLKGRFFWNKRIPQGFQQAVEYFEQAIAKDPGYARAYAGLADSYALMSAYDVGPPSELIPKARTAALKALELDQNLAEAHVSLAVIAQNYDWDWQTAEKEYRRAIKLDPNYATGHHWYAEHLALRGRFDEAFAEMKLARQLDPLSLIIESDDGCILYFSRQYDLAIAEFRAVLAMEPNFPRANMVVFAYVQKGQFDDALADVENWHRVGNDTFWIWAAQAYVYGRARQPVQARLALQKLQLLNERGQVDPFAFVAPYISQGDKDRAIAWLDRSVTEHSPGLTAIKVDPIYDPLRSDPRFQQLLRRVGLTE